MKILLVGEYSRLHNSLKEGLTALGHQVVLVSSGDGFKKYPSDILIKPSIFDKPSLKIFAKFFDKFFDIQLNKHEYYYNINKLVPSLAGFDIVQLINEQAFRVSPQHEIKLITRLIKQNKYVFLLSCGTDYTSVKYALDKKLKYSILTPYFKNKTLKSHYQFILKYISIPNKKLHNFLFSKIKGVISSDLDYHIPLNGAHKYLGLIPNPVNIDVLKYRQLLLGDKIIIFHGVNTNNVIKKGNNFFTDALKIIKHKYQNKVDIIASKDLPYEAYMKAFESCHILLDQVYSYDQGYNALEAMAIGKVVFTGAEKEWLEYYNVDETKVVINALPNTDYIVSKLEWLINNPKKIIEISKNARAFIEKEHDYIHISNEYLKKWTS